MRKEVWTLPSYSRSMPLAISNARKTKDGAEMGVPRLAIVIFEANSGQRPKVELFFVEPTLDLRVCAGYRLSCTLLRLA